MNFNLRTATRLITVVALASPALFIAGCSSSKSTDATASAPPPVSTVDKQKMDEKVQKDSQIIDSLRNKK